MADAGKYVPAIENRPSLTGYEWLWDAFFELDSCRPPAGFGGVTKIPWTAVHLWARANQLSYEEEFILTEVVFHMDKVLIDHYESKTSN